jgi:hypothetical protein
MRALADLPGGEAGEAGAVADQIVPVGGGDQLRARPRVHVDELREVELDSEFLGSPTEFLGINRHMRSL